MIHKALVRRPKVIICWCQVWGLRWPLDSKVLPDEPVTKVACQKASGRECCVGSRSVLHQDGPRKFPTLFQLIDEPFNTFLVGVLIHCDVATSPMKKYGPITPDTDIAAQT